MSDVERCFSPDYVTAQRRFGDAVAARNGRLDSLELTAKGPLGEDLTIDIGWFGTSNPRRVLVHSSGLHGVEAFAGSAIQLQWLSEGIPPLPEDAAVILIHVLNPYGMVWLRRSNENNVDLNRNFLVAGEEFAGAPEGYWKFDEFLNPTTPPSRDLFVVHAMWLIARYGLPKLRQAIEGGQYVNAKGLFFGGKRSEEGPRKLQEYMASRLAGVERIVAIDIHTGLGRFGDDRLLVDAAPERKEAGQMMSALFGPRVQLLDTHGVACEIRGAQYNMYYQLFPKAETYLAAQEFGTYHPLRVVEALRAENRWHHYGAGTVDHPTKMNLLKVFNPKSEKWREAVLKRGKVVVEQALRLALE
jgi:uncharacterized protein DUF2817